MLDHHRLEWRDLHHLVAHRRWNVAGQSGSQAAADRRPVENHVLASLGGEQVRVVAGIALLNSALDPLPVNLPFWGVKTGAITGGGLLLRTILSAWRN